MTRTFLILFFGVAFFAGLALAVLNYFKNKQNDRARHRRERLEEKREELMESLHKKNEQKEDEN